MPADVAKGLAQARHVDRQNPFFDEGVGPESLQQLALGDQASGMTHQDDQYVVRLRGDLDRRTASRQAALRDI
jgi:hypothetical protein